MRFETVKRGTTYDAHLSSIAAVGIVPYEITSHLIETSISTLR